MSNILQITAAADYVAVMADKEAEHNLVFRPVVVWALMRDNSSSPEEWVEGFCLLEDEVSGVEGEGSFIAYAYKPDIGNETKLAVWEKAATEFLAEESEDGVAQKTD